MSLFLKDNRRTYRNFLLDRGYQLRFTMFMVLVCGALLAGLGLWVADVANKATEVATIYIEDDNSCGELLPQPDGQREAADPAMGSTERATVPSGTSDGERVRARPTVTIEESKIEPVKNAREVKPVEDAPKVDAVGQKKAYDACVAQQAEQLDRLRFRKQMILLILVVVGIGIVVGLFFYGIKMTHKVAGPLHKIRLYMEKLRDGEYGPVYDLRKGDQLMDFYEHFKDAHAGLKDLQVQDLRRLQALVAFAEKTELETKSRELADAIVDLKNRLAETEASFGE